MMMRNSEVKENPALHFEKATFSINNEARNSEVKENPAL